MALPPSPPFVILLLSSRNAVLELIVTMYPCIHRSAGNKRSGAATAGSERGVEGGATDRVGYVHRFPDLLKRWDDVDGDRGTW